MIIGALATLALLTGEDPTPAKPPQPTEAELVAEMIRTRPGAIALQQYRHSTSDGDGNLVCGVARIDDRIEPFVVGAVFGPTRAVVPEGAAQDALVRGPDQWRLVVFAPGGANQRGQATEGWNALNRKQVLSACPDLRPPPGVTWDTDPDPTPPGGL